MKEPKESLPALASNIFCTKQDRFAEAAVRLVAASPELADLAAAQWGAIQRILVRSAPEEVAPALEEHFQRQMEKAVKKEQTRWARQLARLGGFVKETAARAEEEFAEALSEAKAMWGTEIPEAALSGCLKGEAVRSAFGSLCRLARAYGTLDAEEREALSHV